MAATQIRGTTQLNNNGSLAALSNLVTREVPSGSVNSSNVTFVLADVPISGTEQVFLNGVLQHVGSGNDYTIADDTITFEAAPLTGDKLHVTYWK